MQLFYSVNSPYARKCRVVIHEKKLEGRVRFIALNPLENPPELWAVNPLGTVPALVTDEGLHLCSSGAICEYLDALSPETPLLPEPAARECVLAFMAIADGIMDAAVASVMERRRPPEKQYAEWIERKEAAITRAIAKCAGVPMAQSPLSLGTIGLAVALAYVSFRLPHIGWRALHPALAEWLDTMDARDAFQKTRPQP